MDTIQNLKTISNNIQSTLQVFTKASTILNEIAIDEIFLLENEATLENFELYSHCLSNITAQFVNSSATGMSTVFPAIHSRIQQVFQLGIDKLYAQFQQMLSEFESIVCFSEAHLEQLSKCICFLVNSENSTGIDENRLATLYVESRKRICARETYPMSCCILECTRVPYMRNSHPILLLLQRAEEIIEVEVKNVQNLFGFQKKLRIRGDLIGEEEIINRITGPIVEEMKKLLKAVMEKAKSLFEPSLLYFDSIFITIDIETFITVSEEKEENQLELRHFLISLAREYCAFNASIFSVFEGELERQLSDQTLAIPSDASAHLLVCRTLHFCKHLASFSQTCDRLVLIGKGGKYSNCIDHACYLLNLTIGRLESKSYPNGRNEFPIEKKHFMTFFLYNNYFCCSLRFGSQQFQERCAQLRTEIVQIFECVQGEGDKYLSIFGIIKQLNLYDSELKEQLKQLLVQSFLPQYMSFVASNPKVAKGDPKKQSMRYPNYSEAELAVQRAFEGFN